MRLIALVLSLMYYGNVDIQHNYGQNPICLSDSIYSDVYKYIVSDSLFADKYINVLNTLTSTCYICFFDEIKNNNDDIEFLYKKLYKLDREYSSDNTKYESFERLFKKYINPDAMLSFSKIVDNELFAKVQMGNFKTNLLGETIFFYIKLDSNRNIELVKRKEMYGL